MAEQDREKPVALWAPSKPALVTSRQWVEDQEALAPSLLATPATARAASSAAMAWASMAAAVGSVGS